MADVIKWLHELPIMGEAEKSREIKSKLPAVVFTPLEKSRMLKMDYINYYSYKYYCCVFVRFGQ
jgi:hypothetical protein